MQQRKIPSSLSHAYLEVFKIIETRKSIIKTRTTGYFTPEKNKHLWPTKDWALVPWTPSPGKHKIKIVERPEELTTFYRKIFPQNKKFPSTS